MKKMFFLFLLVLGISGNIFAQINGVIVGDSLKLVRSTSFNGSIPEIDTIKSYWVDTETKKFLEENPEILLLLSNYGEYKISKKNSLVLNQRERKVETQNKKLFGELVLVILIISIFISIIIFDIMLDIKLDKKLKSMF